MLPAEIDVLLYFLHVEVNKKLGDCKVVSEGTINTWLRGINALFDVIKGWFHHSIISREFIDKLLLLGKICKVNFVANGTFLISAF